MTTQNQENSISKVRGESIVLTGGTNGLGKEIILELAQQGPSQIIFTGRNEDAASQVIDRVRDIDKTIDIDFIYSDHTDLGSVKSATKQIISKLDDIDILILNAGIMGRDPALTKQGYELHFGVNHLAHALMLELLKPLLFQHQSRVVVLGSCFPWRPCTGIDFPTLKTTQDWWYGGRWTRYGQSKLANAVYTKTFAEKNPDISCVCIHPGLIPSTGLWDHKLSVANRIFVIISRMALSDSMEHAMDIITWAATTAKVDIVSGWYYERIGVPTFQCHFAADEEFRRRLWEWTEEELRPWI